MGDALGRQCVPSPALAVEQSRQTQPALGRPTHLPLFIDAHTITDMSNDVAQSRELTLGEDQVVEGGPRRDGLRNVVELCSGLAPACFPYRFGRLPIGATSVARSQAHPCPVQVELP